MEPKQQALEQTTAFPEAAVRPQGKTPVESPDLMKMTQANVWDLKHHPRNVRKHNLAAIEHGLRTYGQQTPLVVQRSTGYVCKGNGTLRVARDVIGWGFLAVSVEDFDDQTALAYLLDDNRASDLSEYDKPALAALLHELDGDGKLQSTLWDLDSAESVWAELGQITVVHPEGFEGGFAETAEELAERTAKMQARPGGLREIKFYLQPAEYEEFALAISKLSRAYGTKGVLQTVVEAVKRSAAQVVA